MQDRKIAVFGGGNGACCTAADLALKGFKINMCEIPEMASSIEEIRKKRGLKIVGKSNSGVSEGFAQLELVTMDAREALEGAKVVFVVVPAFAQRCFAEFMADHLNERQLVVLEPGNFGGALEFAQVLRKRDRPLPLLAEFECMIYSGWKDSPSSCWVGGFKRQLKVAAFPARRTNEALEALSSIYPLLKPAKNIMETGLGNPNTVFHAPMLLTNAGWVEHTKGDFNIYWEGVTPSVGRLVQTVDEERIGVGRELGIDLMNCRDLIISWYGHQGAKGETLQEVMSTNPAYEFEKAPASLQHRYFLEDVPYGLKPLEDLGQLVGFETPTVSAIITLVGKLLGQNFREKARDLRRLGLDGLDASGINELMSEGF